MTGPTQQPSYPIPRPRTGSDVRFTVGLTLDVADVLARHGYPPLTTGADLLRLQQALFTTIYRPAPATEENP
jgi:hypothetical protein